MGLFSRGTRRSRIGAAGSLRRGGDAAGAVEILAELLAQDPDDPVANVEMARSLQLLSDYKGSEEHYRRALAARLDYALVVELAGVVGAQGRGDEASSMLDAALLMTEEDSRLDPGEAHLMRAILANAQGRPTDARAALEGLEDPRTSAALRGYARRLRDRLPPA
jgi:Tfp pilus assembly protein PilF